MEKHMNRIFKMFKNMFRKFKQESEYWVYTKDIIVPDYFKSKRVGNEKWKRKLDYWKKNGKFESPIVLNKDFVLVDGFTSAKIAHLYNIEKVPVYFVD